MAAKIIFRQIDNPPSNCQGDMQRGDVKATDGRKYESAVCHVFPLKQPHHNGGKGAKLIVQYQHENCKVQEEEHVLIGMTDLMVETHGK